MFDRLFFLNFAEKSKAILFCEIIGFSFRWFKIQIFSSTESRTLFFFIGIIFTVYQNLVNYESSFFNQKIIFLIINKNRILILESIPLMRNPRGYPNSHKVPLSHTYPHSHRFFGLTKMWLSGDSTV